MSGRIQQAGQQDQPFEIPLNDWSEEVWNYNVTHNDTRKCKLHEWRRHLPTTSQSNQTLRCHALLSARYEPCADRWLDGIAELRQVSIGSSEQLEQKE